MIPIKKTFEIKRIFFGKKYVVPLVCVLFALVFLILSSFGESGKEPPTDKAEVALGILSDELEDKIRNMCQRVEGVGNVYVMLTLNTSGEYVYATDTERSSTYTKSEFVLTDSGEGIELYVVCPKVRGVAVVCDGGGKAVIKKTLTELISSALGISPSCISIAGT